LTEKQNGRNKEKKAKKKIRMNKRREKEIKTDIEMKKG